MPTFPRGHHAFRLRLNNAKRIAQLTPDNKPSTTTNNHTAADGTTLRGIPAIGHGVAGHVPGTQPESHVCR